MHVWDIVADYGTLALKVIELVTILNILSTTSTNLRFVDGLCEPTSLPSYPGTH